MKKYLIILFIIELIFSFTLKLLNYFGDDSPELHEQILRYFSEDDIKIATDYHREGFGISIVSWIIRNLFFFYIIFSGFSKALEKTSDFFSKGREWLKIVFYVSFIYIIYFLINLPFSFYFGYWVEHQYGFSKMSIGFWIWTKLKTFLLVLIGLNIFSIPACLIIKKFPFKWIFIIPVSGTILGIIISILYPYFILPLYYDVKPIPENSLKAKIENLANKNQISLQNIFIIKESEYSNHTNAFFTGFGTEKKIYLYDTLIEKNTESEIISVLGHEIGHWKYNHTLIGIALEFISSLFQFLIIFFILIRIKKEQKIYMDEFYSPSTIPILFFISTLISTILNPIDSTISRSMEIQADKEALILTKDPESFISAEIKLAKDNKSRLDVHPLVEFIYHSHPKTMDRIKMGESFRITED